jgi:hypothetical protein
MIGNVRTETRGGIVRKKWFSLLVKSPDIDPCPETRQSAGKRPTLLPHSDLSRAWLREREGSLAQRKKREESATDSDNDTGSRNYSSDVQFHNVGEEGEARLAWIGHRRARIRSPIVFDLLRPRVLDVECLGNTTLYRERNPLSNIQESYRFLHAFASFLFRILKGRIDLSVLLK